MRHERRFRLPRVWSNGELRRLGGLFTGRVINVSGWLDSDKEGGQYRDYFPHATEYRISNFRGARGFQGREEEIELDLTQPLPEAMRAQFDVVFNHTTLEHIFDVGAAMHALCELSRDVVIVVVPVAQAQHETESWKDYWRFTPTAMRELFRREGLTVVFESVNRHRNAGVYLVTVASRYPERWEERMPAWRPVGDAASNLGEVMLPTLVRRVLGAVRGASRRSRTDLSGAG